MSKLLATEFAKLIQLTSVRFSLVVLVVFPFLWAYAPGIFDVYGFFLVSGFQVPALSLLSSMQFLLPLLVAITCAELLGSEDRSRHAPHDPAAPGYALTVAVGQGHRCGLPSVPDADPVLPHISSLPGRHSALGPSWVAPVSVRGVCWARGSWRRVRLSANCFVPM